MKTSLGRLLILAFAVAIVLPSSADLTHRYSFTSDASDLVGAANGTLEGNANVTGGVAILDGTTGTYVNLPGGLIQGYTATTIETWATVYPASAAWTRVFDFGAISGNNGRNYLFLTTQSGRSSIVAAISDTDPGYNNEEPLEIPGVKDDGNPFHIAVVWAPAMPLAVLYIDGIPTAWRTDLTIPLSAVDPENCFIGRSLYAPDAYVNADIDEFRIHDNALTTPQIAASVTAGPDTPSYDPGTATALTLALPAETTAGFTETPDIVVDFSIAGSVTMPPIEVTLSSDDTSVLAVTADGRIRAVSPGTATITAEYGGQSDTATINVLPPNLPPAELVNRWSFNEAAGVFDYADSVGAETALAYIAAQGTNDVAVGNGQAEFFGGATYLDGAYIDLPDYILSSKTNLTVEVWTTWNGAADSSWQRIFDCGSSGKGEDPHVSGNGSGSFFLTPRNGANAAVRFDAAPEGFGEEQQLDGPAMLPVGEEVHLVAIYAPDLRKSELWQDGVLIATADAPFPLINLNDVNCWIGLANWNDPPLNGSVNEFRIYEGVLDELEIALSRQAGPDALSTPPGALQTVSVTAPDLVAGNTVPAQAQLLGDFENIPGLDISGLSTSSFSSSDTTVFTVTSSGALTPVRPGTATLTGTYGGMEATTSVAVALPPGYEPANLIHRYSFGEASGTTVVGDSAGSANGELINPSATSDFTGTGRLALSGGAWDGDPQGGYVNLPNGLVSSLTSLTIETWINWAGPADSSWQRIFDIGRNSADDGSGNFVEDQYANPGLNYVYLSPRSGPNTVRFAFSGPQGELPSLDAATLPVGEDVYVAVVYDTPAGAGRLYVNGQRVQSGPLTYALSVVEDLNVYLGRSQWTDPYFAGSYDEFRIYSGTMLDHEVLASFTAGPDGIGSAGPTLTATVQGAQLVIAWDQDGYVLETAGSADASAWTQVGGVVNNQVTVDMTEAAAYYRLSQQ